MSGCDLDTWFAQYVNPDAGTSEPTIQPTEADPTSTDDSQPTTAPTQPTEDVTEPSDIPTEPTQASTEPTEPVPTEPASTEPTEPAPTEPTPTDPVHTHSYTTAVTAPTCTAGGYTTYRCSCGDSYTADKTAAAGHHYQSTVTAPTCTAKGYTTHTCTTCGHSYTDSKTAAAGHQYKHTVIASTCTTGGYITHTCTVCGDSYIDNKTTVISHRWSKWTVTQAPTTTSTGTQTRTCAVCGASQSESLPMLSTTVGEIQQEVLRLVNIERAKEGLAPLEYVYALQEAADIRANEIIESFSHTRPDGSSCFTALDGYNVKFSTAGENIASGFRSAAAVVQAWMNSPGHRANIMNARYTGLVVGIEDSHWVQLFIGS